METLHLIDYDKQLQDALPHLVNHPQYLPFLGKDWKLQQDKLLLVAESHFLPDWSKVEVNSNTWYKGLSLWPGELDHTHTRLVVSRHNNQPPEIKKNHSYFINVEQSIRRVHSFSADYNIFKSIGYCNYFQRPAEKMGQSIKNDINDNKVAYDHLKYLVTFSGVTHIVFTSKKAFNAFGINNIKNSEHHFSGIKINCVPHPTSIWWNRKSWSYGDGKTMSTGKEKFERILSEIKITTANRNEQV